MTLCMSFAFLPNINLIYRQYEQYLSIITAMNDDFTSHHGAVSSGSSKCCDWSVELGVLLSAESYPDKS